MLRVVITQRVDVKPETQERRDALDQAWWIRLEGILKQKLNLFPVPNQQATEEWLEHVAPHLIVLSGGNDQQLADLMEHYAMPANSFAD